MPLILNGTTGVSGVDGSAGTPSYQGNDTNTGIFYPAADTIAFAEGGAEIARFDSSGNLGIGTTAPSQPNGTGLVVYDASLPRVTLRNSTTGTASTDGGGLLMSGNNLFVTNRENGNLIFEAANAAESMRIDSSGNVLVGVSSITGYSGRFIVGIADGNGWYSTIGSTSTGVLLGIRSSTASVGTVGATNLALNPDGGNVGIGTSSPNQKLQVNGNIMSGNGSAANPGYNFTASSATGMFTPDGFVVAFSANGTERMRITSAGVIQAGTTGTGEVFAQNTVKVWGAIAAASTSFYNSFGTSSISKVSTGVFTVNFSRTLASSRFGCGLSQYSAGYSFINTETTTSCRVNTTNTSNSAVDADVQFLIAGGS